MLRQRNSRYLWVVISGLLGLVLLGFLAAVLVHGDPSVAIRYRLSVKQTKLRSLHVLYSGSNASWNDEDDTVIGTLAACSGGACLQNTPVFAGCAARTAHCIPPWAAAPSMPAGLLVPPLRGYPRRYDSVISAMLKSPATKCTSVFGAAPWSGIYTDWTTLCVSQTGIVLYRSVHL